MALTELKSILSNFRRPMNSNPLDKKGKDKVEPIKTSTKDETLSRTSNLAPISSNKSGGDLTKTHLKSFIKTVKLGVFDAFSMPKLNSIIAGNKNEFSNIQITKEPAGANNNSSTVDITRANNGTDNNTSPVYVTNSVLGKNNNSSDVKTVSVLQDRLLSIMNSGLDVDNTPVKYVVSGKLLTDISDINIDYNPPKYINTPSMLHIGSTGPGMNASILDIDTIPLQYQVSGKLLTDISTLNIDSIPLQYQVSGKLLTDISTLNIDSIPTQYQVSGKLLTDISTLNIDSIPTQYKNIVNLGQFNPFNTGQSQLDINSVPNKYIVSGKLLTDISVMNIDSIPNKYSNIVNLGQFNPFNTGQSQLDVNSIPNNYVVSGKLLTDTSIHNIDSIPLRYQNITTFGKFWPKDLPVNSLYNIDSKPSKYKDTVAFGQYQTSGLTYSYTDTIRVPLPDTKWQANGIAGLTTQFGGAGSIFNYIKSGAPSTKQFSKGYSYLSTYGSIVETGRTDAKNSPLYLKSTEENSPSALDELYSKYNLQDDSYNPWYIPQPFVLRGIQRKGNKGLQRWGGSALADDGLIRAGMAASVERSAFDVARLSQWIASPKGLLWVTKQVGLGLSNPIVETGTVVPLPIGQTRIHSGLSSLLSVPTTAFGLHFTRHGLPFINDLASYEKVQQANAVFDTFVLPTNRLVKLKKALIDSIIPGFRGQPILSLSGIGGAQSTYGLGYTLIRRGENTNSHVFISPYATGVLGYNSSIRVSLLLLSATRKGQLYDAGNMSYNPNKNTSAPNPFERKPDVSTPGSTAPTIDKSPETGIKAYQTLAYSKIREFSKRTTGDSITDFRKGIKGNTLEQSFYDKPIDSMGWGQQGKVGVDRSNIKKGFGGEDRVNAIDFNEKRPLTDKLGKGDYTELSDNGTTAKDFIAFYFAGPRHHEGVENGDNVMVFRANIQGFTDSFTPEWNAIKIMGRADSAYIYSGFDRNISFTFTVAATSRQEMKPMWRKINYLATYTMPDYNSSGRMLGPFMRITLGNLFQNTPGFIESLSVSIPDDATWEINLEDDKDMMRVPMMAEITITFKVLADYRPQKLGRAYSLSQLGKANKDTDGNWLADAVDGNSQVSEDNDGTGKH